MSFLKLKRRVTARCRVCLPHFEVLPRKPGDDCFAQNLAAFKTGCRRLRINYTNLNKAYRLT